MNHGLLVAILLAQLTTPNGNRIDVNVAEITSIREPQGPDHWGKGTHCVVIMSNGKFIAVRESCAEVRQMLGEDRLPPKGSSPCIRVCGEVERSK